MSDSLTNTTELTTGFNPGGAWEIALMVSAALIVGYAFYWVFKRLKKEEARIREKGEYELKEFITNNEKDCFNHLKKIFPEYHICPQVSMGAILQPRLLDGEDPNSEEVQARLRNLRYKVGSKIIDFVFMDNKFNPIFIIELDDNSHNVKVKEDNIRDLNLRLAGVDTIRFRRERNTFPNRKEIERLRKEQNM